jgi:hypothetical protein
VEVKEPYQVEISNRFAALENLGDSLDVGGSWNSVTENIRKSQINRF